MGPELYQWTCCSKWVFECELHSHCRGFLYQPIPYFQVPHSEADSKWRGQWDISLYPLRTSPLPLLYPPPSLHHISPHSSATIMCSRVLKRNTNWMKIGIDYLFSISFFTSDCKTGIQRTGLLILLQSDSQAHPGSIWEWDTYIFNLVRGERMVIVVTGLGRKQYTK